MQTILAATDFSDRAERAVKRASSLAKLSNANLVLLHVVDETISTAVFDAQKCAAEQKLKELGESAVRSGVACSFVVKHAEAHNAICDLAGEISADLVIIGSHKRDPIRNAFIGTTAERLLMTGSTPLLVVRSDGAVTYKRPVIAVNLDDDGVSNIKGYERLGVTESDLVTPVFGYQSGRFLALRRAGVTVAALNEAFASETQSIMPTIGGFAVEAGVPVEKFVVKPVLFNTPDTILQTAKELNADLLVVGSHRKTAFKRFMLGSVSEACILHAEQDLLIIPPER